jgi:hypothetical protein
MQNDIERARNWRAIWGTAATLVLAIVAVVFLMLQA